MTQYEVAKTNRRPSTEILRDTELRAVKARLFAGTAFMAIALNVLSADQHHNIPSTESSSYSASTIEFRDGRLMEIGEDGTNTVVFPGGERFKHRQNDPVRFGVKDLRVEPVFGESNLRVEIPREIIFGESNLAVVTDESEPIQR